MSNFVILLLDFVLSVNKYLKQWCLSDGSIMKFIVKTVLLLLCFVLLLFCFFDFFCFYSAFVLLLFCFVLHLFCFFAFVLLLVFGFWILAFLMTWLLFLHHKNIISFSKYSIVRLSFVDLRWAQLYVSLVISVSETEIQNTKNTSRWCVAWIEQISHDLSCPISCT